MQFDLSGELAQHIFPSRTAPHFKAETMARRGRAAPAPARRPAPAPSRSAPPAPARAPAQPPAAPAPQQSSGGGLLGTMAQGFAFGTGSAVAHRAVGAIMGGGSSDHAPVEHHEAVQQAPVAAAPVAACTDHSQAFYQCLTQNQGNVTACQFYFDALQQCQAASQY